MSDRMFDRLVMPTLFMMSVPGFALIGALLAILSVFGNPWWLLGYAYIGILLGKILYSHRELRPIIGTLGLGLMWWPMCLLYLVGIYFMADPGFMVADMLYMPRIMRAFSMERIDA
jgi:hypothetical protein